jgi:chemotaxis protein MotB
MKRKNRRHKHEEHENHERWLVSYADFITLLFAFFVVLYATSSQNTEKEKQFEESIRESMKLPATQGIGGAAGAGGSAASAPTLAQQAGIETPAQNSTQARLAANAELQEKLEKEVEEKMNGDEKQAVSSLRHDMFGVRMSLAASTLFPTGSAKLRREALPVLEKIAQMMKTSAFKMLVEGHTDDQPIIPGGEYDSNWELASARATQVVRYLAKVHGIPESRLAAVSYADQRPLVPNINDQNRTKNRRIEILFITGDSPYDDF